VARHEPYISSDNFSYTSTATITRIHVCNRIPIMTTHIPTRPDIGVHALTTTLEPEMMFCRHSMCHILSLTGRSSSRLLFPTSPGNSRVSKLKNISRKSPSGIEVITVRCIRICSQLALIIPRIKNVSVVRSLEISVTGSYPLE